MHYDLGIAYLFPSSLCSSSTILTISTYILDDINASTATLAPTPASVDPSTTDSTRDFTPPLTVDAPVPSTSSDSNELNDSPRDTPPLPSILKNKSSAPSRSSSLDDNRDATREPEVDPQILEALKSVKDRLFVLKLGEQMESLIQERRLASIYFRPLSWTTPVGMVYASMASSMNCPRAWSMAFTVMPQRQLVLY